MRVLLVEDNEMNRDMLSRRLRRAGHEVLSAEDGRAGVERARLERPDIVLMDISLPVMDGLTATREIRRDPGIGSVPIVALTANALVDDRIGALDAGCDDFQTKPVDMQKLLATIARLCPAKITA
jgi:two-component system cell cycle response regulator DivK